MIFLKKNDMTDEKITRQLSEELCSLSDPDKEKISESLFFDMDKDMKYHLSKINLHLKLLRLKIRMCKNKKDTPVVIYLSVMTEESTETYTVLLELTKDSNETSCFYANIDTPNKVIILHEELLKDENQFLFALSHELGHIIVGDGSFPKHLKLKNIRHYKNPEYHHQHRKETLCDLFALLVCRSFKVFKRGQLRYPDIPEDEKKERSTQFDYLRKNGNQIESIYGVTKENANCVNVNFAPSINIYSPYPYSITG